MLCGYACVRCFRLSPPFVLERLSISARDQHTLRECACQQILILQRLGTMRRRTFETLWHFNHVNAFWCEPVCWTSRFASSLTGACAFSGSGLVGRAHSKFLQVALHETRLYKLKLSHTLPILHRPRFPLNPWRLFFFRSALSRNCQSHQWNTWWNGVSLCPGRLWNWMICCW